MAFINNVMSYISNFLYTYVLDILLIAGGIYFSLRTKFVQLRHIPQQLKSVIEKPDSKVGVSSFQALMVSTASRVGTGNIIGVSAALCLGGFGSVFWMWLIAIIGGAAAFAESTLAQIFKRKGEHESYGGPAYYIEATLNSRLLAIIFSVFLILTYGFGFNMLGSYNLQSTFSAYNFYNPQLTPWIIGIVLAAIVAYCLIGGGKRIVKVTSFLIPVMGLCYIIVAFVIVAINYHLIPGIFERILKEAFDIKAIFAGFSGSCIMYGVKRGLFSNEAGVGSAPNASASADVKHPVKQGLVQVLSVFLDTILVCSATAFMCMCSGVEPTKALNGAPYVQKALSAVMGSTGPVFITAAMLLFAFTTLLGNLYYVDRSLFFMYGRPLSKKAKNIFHIIASLIIFLGAGLSADLLWNIADITMGAMAIINVPVIVYLGKYVIGALKDYDKQLKAGKDPVFYAKNIALPYKTDYWN